MERLLGCCAIALKLKETPLHEGWRNNPSVKSESARYGKWHLMEAPLLPSLLQLNFVTCFPGKGPGGKQSSWKALCKISRKTWCGCHRVEVPMALVGNLK